MSMKELLLTYKGLKNNKFSFLGENNEEVSFSKCRNDLVRDFHLKQKNSLNKKFIVKYFINYTGGNENQIISDLIPA